MKKIITLLLLLIPFNVFALDITESSNITINNSKNSKLTDKKENNYASISKGNTITINNEDNIYGLYIIYEKKSVEGSISNNTKSERIGQNGFLHEYINVDKLIGAAKEITITYDEDVQIGEIYVLSEGDLPLFVEVWDKPLDEADLVLFSTHSDDEQLFFAGLMPHYVAKGAKVQVVYFTNHNDNPKRLHEQIHGLYKVGIRNYPVIGFVPDAWSTNLNGALSNLSRAGYTEDDTIKFMVEMIRRFKPLVVVGHDEAGEYSHGQHILNTHVLKKALELTNDSEYDLDSAQKYGLWEVPKTYLHLYKENKIVMNYDIPLDYFNGKTAYEVSKEGYKEHHSQQDTWFTKWLTGVNSKGEGVPYKKASEIKAVKSPISGVISTFSPCEYGLYRTLVGEDVDKNDMFENLTLRKDEVKEETPISSDEKKDENKKASKIKLKKYIPVGIGIIIVLVVYITQKKKKVR